MSDEFDLAASLFGSRRLETSNERRSASATSTVYGTAVSDSADGSVQVVLDNGSVSAAMPDGTEGDNVLTLATSPAVKKGDTVLITAVGGTSKQMTVTAVVASGDRNRDQAASAEVAAAAAEKAAAEAAGWRTLIVETDEGVAVGKSSDGETFETSYALVGAGFVAIRDRNGTDVARFAGKKLLLGIGESGAIIDMLDGGLKVGTYNDSDGKDVTIVSKSGYDLTLACSGGDAATHVGANEQDSTKAGMTFSKTEAKLHGASTLDLGNASLDAADVQADSVLAGEAYAGIGRFDSLYLGPAYDKDYLGYIKSLPYSGSATATASAEALPLAAGEITQVQLTAKQGKSDDFLAVSGGGVKCQSAGYVKVSGSVYIGNDGDACSQGAYIKKGASFTDAVEIASCYVMKHAGAASVAPKVIAVSNGDVIYLAARSDTAQTCYPSNAATYLTVEYVT